MLACYVRPRVFITPREPLATSPPYRPTRAPDALPCFERLQHASRRVYENLALADRQADEARQVRGQHFGCHPALALIKSQFS
jgi:hypothetical protein